MVGWLEIFLGLIALAAIGSAPQQSKVDGLWGLLIAASLALLVLAVLT